MKTLLPAQASSLLALTLLGLTWAGCHQPVVLAKDPPPLHESEPNDTADLAPWFGTLAPGSRLAIQGHITSGGPDFFDGFAFTAGAPCTVHFALTPSLPGADLDLCLYDPWLDAFVACFDGTDVIETGAMGFAEAGTDFHLVVTSAWASSSYLLEIEVTPFAPTPVPAASVRGKHTLERIEGYRGSAPERSSSLAPSLLALGWIGELDPVTGKLERIPFALTR